MNRKTLTVNWSTREPVESHEEILHILLIAAIRFEAIWVMFQHTSSMIALRSQAALGWGIYSYDQS
jgi:hypothetical protein